MQSEISFTKGLALLQDSNFEKAIEEFASINVGDPEWADAQYYKGFCLNQLERYEEAVNVLENLLKKYPNRSDARAQLALSLAKQGKETSAQEQALKAHELKELVPPELEESKISDRMKKRFFHFLVSTGIQYDSNIILSPSSLSPTLEVYKGNLDDSKGVRQNFVGFVEVSPWIFTNTQVGGSYTFFYSRNYEFSFLDYDYEPSDYNFMAHRGCIFANHETNRFLIQFPYTFDILFKGSEQEHFWTGHSIEPTLSWPVVSFFQLRGSFRFRTDNYAPLPDDPNQDQDAKNIALAFDPTIFFARGEKGFLSTSYRLEFNLADGDDWDYLGNRIQGELKFKPFYYFIKLTGAITWRNFSHLNSLTSIERSDRENYLEGSVGREGKIFLYSLDVSYITNNSNIVEYAYKRLIGSFNISLVF